MGLSMYELIGYIGSALVLVSFMMSSVVKLRMVNMTGAIISMIYGLLIQAYPTVVMNGVIVVINLYQLIRIANHSDVYELLPVKKEDSLYTHFLDYYGKDILTFFPDFLSENVEDTDMIYMVCCNAVPASILICRRLSEYSLEILLDYSIPQYRDYSIGKYQFRQLTHMGYHKAVFHGKYEKHTRYLEKMEFIKEGEDYVKTW